MKRDLFYYPSALTKYRIEKRYGLYYPQKRVFLLFWVDIKGYRGVTLSAAWELINIYRKARNENM